MQSEVPSTGCSSFLSSWLEVSLCSTWCSAFSAGKWVQAVTECICTISNHGKNSVTRSILNEFNANAVITRWFPRSGLRTIKDCAKPAPRKLKAWQINLGAVSQTPPLNSKTKICYFQATLTSMDNGIHRFLEFWRPLLGFGIWAFDFGPDFVDSR